MTSRDRLQVQVKVCLLACLYGVRVALKLRLILVENVLRLILRLAKRTLLVLIGLSFASKDTSRIYCFLKWLLHLCKILLMSYISFANLEFSIRNWFKRLPHEVVIELGAHRADRGIQVFNLVRLMRHHLEKLVIYLVGRNSCLDLII